MRIPPPRPRSEPNKPAATPPPIMTMPSIIVGRMASRSVVGRMASRSVVGRMASRSSASDLRERVPARRGGCRFVDLGERVPT
jgi:hypothetical protein